MSLLILLRHGQSMWNAMNVFTGWVDVPLSEKGINEAIATGKQIADIKIDCVYTSTLVRAKQTAMLALSQQSSGNVPIMISADPTICDKSQIHNETMIENSIPTYSDWRLNDRFYGDLQGKNKAETAEKYGTEQVKIWRRSFDVPPPNGESLKMTCERTLPCLAEKIQPQLDLGKTLLVSAHGNSLRSIVMEIEGLNEEQVLKLEIATGEPLFYHYSDGVYKRKLEA